MVPYLEAIYHVLAYQGNRIFLHSQSNAQGNLAPVNFPALCDSCLYLEPDEFITVVVSSVIVWVMEVIRNMPSQTHIIWN